ncbi:MAG: hypothetical protein KDA87_19040 [Planctomycetales bacterium]|nr:hypothetical protein [Planctomycetales bacterium]
MNSNSRVIRAVTQVMLFGGIVATVCSTSDAQVRSNRTRKLAPGTIVQIEPTIEAAETFTGPIELIELTKGVPNLQWDPNFSPQSETLFAMAKETTFRRPIWALEIGFKPMRMLEMPVIDSNGVTRTKKVWYLMYYVRNSGNHLRPSPQEDERGHTTFTTETVKMEIRFFPNFVLESHEFGKAYLDSVIPGAVERIRRREDPSLRLYDSISISSVPIKVSSEGTDNRVWGVATWDDVDPRTDFFSVYVRGLTNAYRWQDPEDFQPGDEPGEGREFTYKTLQLNFWRPGDAINPDEMEFRYGLPTVSQLPPNRDQDEVLKIYRLPERVDYRWVYR